MEIKRAPFRLHGQSFILGPAEWLSHRDAAAPRIKIEREAVNGCFSFNLRRLTSWPWELTLHLKPTIEANSELVQASMVRALN